ncbi:MAG: AAA family ATPase [Candidatus Lokiarchaeota archaeon]
MLRDSQQLVRKLENRVITKGDILSFYSYGRRVDLIIVDYRPDSEAVIIKFDTKITLSEKTHKELSEIEKSRITYEDIGGLKDSINKIREMIELPIRHPEIFQSHQPPPAAFSSMEYRTLALVADETYVAARPSIIFIDEMDSIAPKRGEVTGEVERRVVAQLLSLMDGLEERGEIIIIGATNRINDIDPALRRPGRFDREIEIGVPDQNGRYEILLIHTRGMPLSPDVDLKILAQKTHGFVGADIESLAKEAAMLAIREIIPKIDLQKAIPLTILNEITINMNHLLKALSTIEPSALREVLISKPRETWNEIGGLEGVKQQLREIIEWSLKYPNIYKHFKSEPPNGILLYGPPGTGKTLIARALAHESEVNFISIKGPELISKWVGESEKAIREIFRKAKSASPCIIFFDEIDAITGTRGKNTNGTNFEQIVSQLLTEMDGLEELTDVILLAATNRPDILDPALLRSGRFGRHIEFKMPDFEARKRIFMVHLKNKPLSEDIEIEKLAKVTEGYSGADIKATCQEAILLTIRRTVSNERTIYHDSKDFVKNLKVTNKEFEAAIEKINISVKRAQKAYSRELNVSLGLEINTSLNADGSIVLNAFNK